MFYVWSTTSADRCQQVQHFKGKKSPVCLHLLSVNGICSAELAGSKYSKVQLKLHCKLCVCVCVHYKYLDANKETMYSLFIFRIDTEIIV